MSKWRVTKERIFLRDENRWSYPGWSLYFNNKRVARYLHWNLCIDHIETYYRKFGLRND